MTAPSTSVPRPDAPAGGSAVLGASRTLREAAAAPLAARVPARWLEAHAVLPLACDGEAVTVAVEGPLDPLVEEVLARRYGVPVRPVPHPPGDVRAALVAARERAVAGPAGGDAAESLDDLRALAEREPVVQLVNAMLADAVRAGASDVHLEAEADGLRVRLRLDGVLHETQRLGAGVRAAVVSRLKVLAGLDIAERRLPQDGRTRLRVADRELDVRVATLPALHGESLVLRLLDAGGDDVRALESLGFAPPLEASLRRALGRSSGLLLVTGPTGSGKTTTLYAALAERTGPGVKVVTVEDPVEYRLPGALQLPVNPKAGFGFARALRAILRNDPDVVLVGELRDLETAEIAVQAALTGHLVVSTLHTTDAAAALPRLVDMGIAPYLVAATLHAVLAQRLVRVTCAGCGAWRALTPEERTLLGGTGLDRVREGRGCTACAGTGFRGRRAIAELLVLDEPLRSALVGGATLHALRAHARAAGVASLRDDGWRLVREGATTIAEVVRVVSEEEDAP